VALTRLIGEDNRKLYGDILLKAAQSCNQAIILFCKEHIYPLYLDACDDARMPPSEHMTSIYGGE
jgi:hypothetical protein